MVLRVSQKMIFGRRSGYQSYRGIAFVGVMTKFEKRIKLILYHRQPMNMTPFNNNYIILGKIQINLQLTQISRKYIHFMHKQTLNKRRKTCDFLLSNNIYEKTVEMGSRTILESKESGI